MAKSDLLEYLGTIIELEKSVYTQKETWSKLEKEKNSLGKKGTINCKKVHSVYFGDYFTKGVWIFAFLIGVAVMFVKLFGGMGSSRRSIIDGISNLFSSFFKSLGGLFIGTLIGVGIGLVYAILRYAVASAQVRSERRAAENDYISRVKRDDDRVSTELAVAKMMDSEQRVLAAQMKKTEDLLAQYYDIGIIYPTYRNFVAVCSLYQYIDSGVCDKLTGHEGAYNKYDLECRLDMIIFKLDVVIEKLEDIKQVQIELYNAINDGNRKIDMLIGEVKKQTKYIKASADNSAAAAANSAMSVYTQQQTLNEVRWGNNMSHYRMFKEEMKG